MLNASGSFSKHTSLGVLPLRHYLFLWLSGVQWTHLAKSDPNRSAILEQYYRTSARAE